MDRLSSVKEGDGLSAKWADNVIAEIRRTTIIPGKGLKKTVTSKGTRLDLVDELGSGGGGEGVPSDVIPCIVNGGTAVDGYSVTLYLNGFDHTSRSDIKTGTLFLPEVATHTNIPASTSILAHICDATFMQSDEQEDEDELNPEEEEQT